MAKIYCRHIKAGTKTMDDVPDLWKAAVQALLDEDGKDKE